MGGEKEEEHKEDEDGGEKEELEVEEKEEGCVPLFCIFGYNRKVWGSMVSPG